MKLFLTEVVDFFLPRFCPSCSTKLLSHEISICKNCSNEILLADNQRIEFEFNKKFKAKKLVEGFTSLYVFEKDKQLQEILHHFKYSNKFLIGIELGRRIANKNKDLMESWKIDLILPVPLHHLKKAERSYNQSVYIVKGISEILKISYNQKILKRKRYTESQTLKNILERELNVIDAFSVSNEKKIRGKNLLLVDDVITTGATISECARQLLNAGANKIFAASIAIAD